MMEANPLRSPIVTWKSTDQSDLNSVRNLITDDVVETYGEFDLARLIEFCSASITLYNEEKKAVALMVFYDYPNIESIKLHWPEWIAINYGLDHLSPMNTMFIHLMAFDTEYYPDFFPIIMEKIYSQFELVEFVLLILPPKTICYNLLTIYFDRVHKREDVEPDQIHSCYVNNRWLHFGIFSLKKSGEDEGDTITLKVKKVCLKSKTKFTEIVIHKDKYRTCIVEETPVAGDCICLNTKIDFSRLSELYNLKSVNGFKWRSKKNPKDDVPIKISGPRVFPIDDYKMNVPHYVNRAPDVTDSCPMITEIEEENLIYEDVILLEQGRLLSYIPYVTRQAETEDEEPTSHSMQKQLKSSSSSSLKLDRYFLGYDYKTVNKMDFTGEPNAFSLELLLIYNKKARLIDYMRKIFEFSPANRSFCLIEIPSSAKPPAILNYFYKFDKFDRMHPFDLYAAHQLAITGKITVRECWPSDMEDIIGMTLETTFSSGLHKYLCDIFFNNIPDRKVFAMLAENLLVGISVVSSEININYLKKNYEIEELICTHLTSGGDVGVVQHFIVSPLFYHYVRYFLKEIMTQTGYKALFYILYSRKLIRTIKTMTWPSGLQMWVPILPRRLGFQSKIKKTDEDIRVPTKHLFSLFFVSRQIASMTLHMDYTKLVIVGDSDTAKSLIENLIYSKRKCYFNFADIKLVTADSFITCDSTDFEVEYDTLMPMRSKFNLKYMDTVGYSAYVDVCPGRITNINREMRTIEIDFSYHLPYDYLFLCCGMQFTRPDMKSILVTESKRKHGPQARRFKFGKSVEDYYRDYFPINLFLLDSLCDIDNFINYVIYHFRHFTSEDCFIVYGGRIEAWACISFLLRHIPGKAIAFVENLHEGVHSVDAFNNPLIHEACKNNIINSDVRYYSSYELVDWEIKKQKYFISKVNFLGNKNSLQLKCSGFISFSLKTMHPLTTIALKNSGLEFDNKVVIDHKFRTSDARIYAAGSMTKYSQDYYYEDFNHEFYNSTEVGAKLAEIFSKEVCGDNKVEEAEQETPPLIEMTEPLFISCVLPVGFHYLKISPPGPLLLFEQLATLGKIGKIMVTGNVNDKPDPKYFRILLDKFDKVMEVTCFTTTVIDVVSISRLYGKHEQLLNDLCWRYDNAMISDFFDYFSQPWTSVIFHDRFDHFLNQVFPLYENIKDPKDKKLYLKLSSQLNSIADDKVRNAKKYKMMKILNKNGLDKDLCNSLMGFLEFNKDLLSKYLTPSKLNEHKKDNYYMNQLLEPPEFAKDHLKNYIKQEGIVDEISESDDQEIINEITYVLGKETSDSSNSVSETFPSDRSDSLLSYASIDALPNHPSTYSKT